MQSATIQAEITNSDKTIGLIIGLFVVFIIIMIVVVMICSNPTDSINKAKVTVKTLNPIQPKMVMTKQASPPRPRVPELINNVMQTRRAQGAGQLIHNNFIAAQILDTLRVANHFGDIHDPRLPIVIDLAVAIPNDPFTDRKLQEILMESANHTRDKIIGNRRAVAKNEPTPAARMDKYIELSTTNTSDPQNSHDSYVNLCLRKIMTILREDQKELDIPSVYQIRCEIQRKYNIEPPKSSDNKEILGSEDTTHLKSGGAETKNDSSPQSVLTIIDTMYNNGASHYNVSIQATEAEVLQRVWLRTLDKRNEAVKEKMQDMIYNSLESSYEGGNIVCINGRCAKILSSMVMLDFDERMHELQTLEQFKNNIFIKVRELVKDRSRKALTSSDPKVVTVAKSYLSETAEDMVPPETIDKQANTNFAIYLRGEISKMVKEQAKELPPEIVKHIITECIAAI